MTDFGMETCQGLKSFMSDLTILGSFDIYLSNPLEIASNRLESSMSCSSMHRFLFQYPLGQSDPQDQVISISGWMVTIRKSRCG